MPDLNETSLGPSAEKLRDLGGTDLLLSADAPVTGRVAGKLQALGTAALSGHEIDKMIAELLSPVLLERFRADGEVDFSTDWPGVARFRGNAFKQRGTSALALRVIPSFIPTFEQLGLPQ